MTENIAPVFSGEVLLMPRGETVLGYLGRLGKEVESSAITDWVWHEIDKDRMPVLVTKTNLIGPAQYSARILYNKEEFDKYRKTFGTLNLEQWFYTVKIDDLLEVSNLFKMRNSIEIDRTYRKQTNGGRQFLDPDTKAQIFTMIGRELNKTMNGKQIAKKFGISYAQIQNLIKQAKDAGMPVDTPKSTSQIALQQLMKTNPELFPHLKTEPIGLPNTRERKTRKTR